MKNEQQKQAEKLYFQTDLSNSEIADMLGISRRTLQYWISDLGWDQLKHSAKHMPLMLAQNCYFIMARLQESILADGPGGPRVITMQEVNMLAKLANTIHKLRTRATLNESMEMLTHFMQHVACTEPSLTDTIRPVVDSYLQRRAVTFSSPASAPAESGSHDHKPQPAQANEEPMPMSDANSDPHPTPLAANVAQKTDSYTDYPTPHNPLPSGSGRANVRHTTTQPSLKTQGLNRAQRRQMMRDAA